MSGILQTLFLGAAAAVKDAYFNLVTLLLNTTATNGAQNNTFLDSSTNNFSITRNGNATQGTFTPFSQTGWSNKLSSGNNLSSPSNAGYQFDSGNFTVEGWIYFNTVGNAQFLSIPVVGALYWQYFAGALDFGNNAGGSVQASWSPVANTWYHVAAVRNGSTFTNYINGAVHSSGSAFNVTATGTLQVGYGGAGSFDGYFSNVRIVKGTAVYTAAFTPPTAPLTAISGTQLLICQSNRFADSSTNALTLTVNGSPSVQAFSPFTPTTAYDAAVVGGSYYGDGSGDYLAVADTTSLKPATGDFCFETWVYHTRASNGSSFDTYTFQTSGGLFVYRTLSNKIQVDSDGVIAILTSASNVPVNAWTHIAVTRSGTTLRIFINGVVDASVTNSTNISGSGNITYGGRPAGSILEGYLSSTRFVKGSAVYTATFAPPTAPLTAITNTSILLNYTNAGIYDSAAKNVMETVSSVQVSTTQSKFPPTSIWFQAGGTLAMANNPGLQFGTGDFTVEWFMYWNTVNNSGFVSGSGNGSTDIRYSSGALYLGKFNQSLDSSFAWTPSTGQWYHVAMTRSGSSVRAFVNGSQIGSTATNSNTYNCVGTSFYVGTITFGASGDTPLAYIQQYRITKGYARYTANFTPPAAAFPIQ